MVGGAPGSGKTTLSREIARRLRLGLIAKDDVKEAIADVVGTGDMKHSRMLGSAAFAVMRAVAARSLEEGASVVLEANFHRDESVPWLRELAAVAETRVVICKATADEHRRRFAGRKRHPVHLDREILEDDWPPDSEFELDLGVPTLAVDTTSGYAPGLDAIMRFLARQAAPPPQGLPGWLRPVSRLNVFLLRRGLRIGTQHVLTIKGRRTGRSRSTPVSLVTLEGVRYAVAGEGLSWVRNARAAKEGELLRGGRRERVRLTELPPVERAPVLRAFWYQVRGGRKFIARLFGLPADASADDFAAAAPRCPVFRIDSLSV